jgi:DNA-binding LacI/PurR family transcriptional regulator
MGIDGIGRGFRPAQTTETGAPQAPVSPRPAAAEAPNTAAQPNPVGDFFRDTFESVKAGAERIWNQVAPGVNEVVQQAAQGARDAQMLQDMRGVLADSPTGAAALQYMDQRNIPVQFANGGGSYWDGRQIVIDRTQGTQDAALTLVHEINHAKATFDGPQPNIMTDTRANYVQGMLAEEVRGTVDSIRAKNELVANGRNVTATFPLEREYNDAYNQAVQAARTNDPSLAQDRLRAIGEQAGYDAVLNGFNTGRVQTSTTRQPYPAFYGEAWDRAHPTPTP